MAIPRRPRAARFGSPESVAHGSDGSPAPAISPNDHPKQTRSEDRAHIKATKGDEVDSGYLDGTSTASFSSDIEQDLADISFGALVRALSPLSKKEHAKASGVSVSDGNDHMAESLERRLGKKDSRTYSRSSKHAPTELSSKHAVSRKRSVVDGPKRDVRDPRFDSVTGPLLSQKIEANYKFLEGYRAKELATLKTAIETLKPGDEQGKYVLEKELHKLESRKKAKDRKDRELEVIKRHRREERGRVAGGKQPFYLKRGEVKTQAMIDRFDSMKGKEIDRAMERRRRKRAVREKRAMPDTRRLGVDMR